MPFYLATEEFVARNLPAAEYFFVWQSAPTVICGRNQRIDIEVDRDYCAKNGIDVCRRRSGGGCVYADMNNLMFSYITPAEDVTTTFGQYTAKIAGMLKNLGLNACATGRNDILIDERKVSGNAFYHIQGRSIVHGTMLYDTDFRHMTNAITPARSKLESNQVQSVPSRITTLSQHIDLSIDDFKKYAIQYLTDYQITLSKVDITEIEKIEQRYYEPKWLEGRKFRGKLKDELRVTEVGQIAVNITNENGRIADMNLTGDFFPLCDAEFFLKEKLRGVKIDKIELQNALSDIDCSNLIAGLSTERFIELIIN